MVKLNPFPRTWRLHKGFLSQPCALTVIVYVVPQLIAVMSKLNAQVSKKCYLINFLHFIQLRIPDFKSTEFSVLTEICRQPLFGFT